MTWNPPTPNYATPAPIAVTQTEPNVLGIIAAVGAAALCLGSFLPWVKVSAGIFGTLTIDGMSGDGKFTAAIGAIAAVLLLVGALTANRDSLVAGTVVAGLGGLVAAYDLVNISRLVDVNGPVSTQIGGGLYLCVAGALAAVVLGIIAATQTN